MRKYRPVRGRQNTVTVLVAALSLVWLGSFCPAQGAGAPLHHDLTVVLKPADAELSVADTVTFPEGFPSSGGAYDFALHPGWTPAVGDPQARLTAARVPGGYTVALPPGQRSVRLTYTGRLGGARGAEAGDNEGDALTTTAVVLSHGSHWYPVFGDDLVTFTLSVRAPTTWEIVSQGKRTVHRRGPDEMEVRWESPEPQDDIFIVGGPLTEYVGDAQGIATMAFLRTPDTELADRYLGATVRYLSMYSALLGLYPYPKFAMVENAWETGFGMPSFTLLGSTVIRLPFILDSSYPHEILHNWWGNGVFVDPSGGNWSEGLTAYLADHLLAEQRGTGVEYRRAALQKYTDYVTQERDFPLAEFQARHDPVSEAVGYSKALMVFHMTRRDLGDGVFLGALRDFYNRFRFQRASFADLDSAFARAMGQTTGPLGQWLPPGAPALRVSNAELFPMGDRYLLEALVEQTQPGKAYRLQVPVAVTLAGQEQAFRTTFELRTKHRGLELFVPGRPLRLDVDPEFDLFRRLDRGEFPPALSQLFGAKRLLVVLPAAAPQELRAAYAQLAEALGRSTGSVQVARDDTIEALPGDRAVWVLGWDNRFRGEVAAAVAGLPVTITDQTVTLAGVVLPRGRHQVVIAARRPGAADLGLGWAAADQVEALPGLARKLPHYGKYGYLGFEGAEPTNVAKGEWPVIESPLAVPVRQADGSLPNVARARLAPRTALGPGGSGGTPAESAR